jgi:type VI secretion system protein ImpM
MTLTPGWFGKLPSLGDFASRRLPDEFIARWDAWLQHGMAASRALLGDRWLEIYLTSPIWRFGLMPGVIGEPPWAGVLMPSVDKVGRHFPLTIALELSEPAMDDPLAAIVAAQAWFADVERAALSALDASVSAGDLDAQLEALSFPPQSAAAPDAVLDELAQWWLGAGQQPHATEVPNEAAVTELMSALARKVFKGASAGKTIWWAKSSDTGSFEVNCIAGLPDDDYFAALLLGIQWRRTASMPAA